jgi:hypothetical protein
MVIELVMSLDVVLSSGSVLENTMLHVVPAVDVARALTKAAALLATLPVGITYWV